MDLTSKKLVLGMTGGIAAYKVCELTRRLLEQGATVQVVMTRAAQEFVTQTTMQALSGLPVFTDQWGEQGARVDNAMPHIDVSRDADAIIVAPASAHFLAKTAQGLADDLLSTLVLARKCPLLVAPAMNVEMWHNPATQRNLQLLREDGVTLLGPDSGEQACGELGTGRMLEAQQLLEDIIAFFQPKLLHKRRVVLTAGPTFEPIDPVRGITNASSGKMGFALARAAVEAGAEVTLIAGPTALSTPRGVKQRFDVVTARQMHHSVMEHAPQADVFISVAAVADWAVVNAASNKLKKAAGAPVLKFEPNPDILAAVAALPGAPMCVGFAAESNQLIEQARSKLASKKLAMIVANQVQQALGTEATALTVIDGQSMQELPHADKLTQARRLIALIAERLLANQSLRNG